MKAHLICKVFPLNSHLSNLGKSVSLKMLDRRGEIIRKDGQSSERSSGREAVRVHLKIFSEKWQSVADSMLALSSGSCMNNQALS